MPKESFLFFLDSDNYLRKDCLETHYAFLKRNKDCTACYAPIQKFDDETRKMQNIFSNEAYDFNKISLGNYIDAMAMIKKVDLINLGLYDEQMPRSGWEDYELWLRMGVNKKKVSLIESEPLSFYRTHKDSMVNAVTGLNYELLRLYLNNIYNINVGKRHHNIDIIPAICETECKYSGQRKT